MSRISRVMLAAVLVALMAACTSAPPKPKPDATTPVPVVTEDQVATIMTALTDTVAVADASLDGDVAATRLEGPALSIRRADYVVAAAGHELPSMVIERDVQQPWTVVAQTTTWPRVVLVMTELPTDLQGTPRILVLRQDSPRDPYRLWGSAELGSGKATPEMVVPDKGSQSLPSDHKDLVVTPSDVFPQYVDVLKNGDASEYAASFVGADQDGIRRSIEATRTKILAKKGDGPGSYTETFAAAEEPIAVLADNKGGALVIGDFTTTAEVSGIDVSAAAADDPMLVRVAALAGTLAESMTWTYTGIVVFYVPSAEKPGPIVVVAFAHKVTSAAAL